MSFSPQAELSPCYKGPHLVKPSPLGTSPFWLIPNQLITSAIILHLLHILLARTKSQVPPTLKGINMRWGRKHGECPRVCPSKWVFVFFINSKIHEVFCTNFWQSVLWNLRERGDGDKQELQGKNRKHKARGRSADWRRRDITMQWWAEELCWSNDFLWKKRRWALALSLIRIYPVLLCNTITQASLSFIFPPYQ